jgi:hypothetical protein
MRVASGTLALVLPFLLFERFNALKALPAFHQLGSYSTVHSLDEFTILVESANSRLAHDDLFIFAERVVETLLKRIGDT